MAAQSYPPTLEVDDQAFYRTWVVLKFWEQRLHRLPLTRAYKGKSVTRSVEARFH